MRILITGATGFVGRNLLPELFKTEHSLLCVVRDKEKLFARYSQQEKQLQACCIEEEEEIKKFNPQICIHLASFLSSRNDAETSSKIVESNLAFGCKLLNILKDCKELELFLNFGTFAEYRLGPACVSQAYLYSASKTAFKEILKYYADITPFKYLHIIPYTIYGGIDTQKKVIDIIKDSIDSSEPLKMSKGEQILDFIHVADVVSFVIYILNNKEKFIEEDNYDYHLGTGKGTSIRELAVMIERKYKKKCNIDFGALPYRERDVMYAVAPIAQLIKMGWGPSKSLYESI